MTTTPYEVLIRLRNGQAFASVRTLTTVNGVEYENPPVDLDLAGPEFEAFKTAFNAATLTALGEAQDRITELETDLQTASQAAQAQISQLEAELLAAQEQIAELESLIPVQSPRLLYPYEFLNRFTQQERLAIASAVPTDPMVMMILTGLFTVQRISLDDPETIAGVNYLVQIEMLTTERGAEVLA